MRWTCELIEEECGELVVAEKEFGLQLDEMRYVPTCEENKAPSCRSSRVWVSVVCEWKGEVKVLMLRRRWPLCRKGQAGSPGRLVVVYRSFLFRFV